jgi:hypothetical protein
MSHVEKTQQKRRPQTKAGRTLLVKPSGSQFNASVFDELVGRQSTHHTEKSNSYFITFATPQESLTALKTLKTKHGQTLRVKFAHYRIFFKIEGLTNESDYNTIKKAHTELITKNNITNVLFYRLYRKNDSFIGSGDLTVDTKEGFDNLVDTEKLKNFTISESVKGVHYRYKKNDQQTSDNA